MKMKQHNHGIYWALFLLAGGLFLLLKSLNIFQQYGEAIWGGLFAVTGLGFLVWFLIGRQHAWRAIAGFPLVAIGAHILLAWRGIALGDWQAPLILFGVALGFWTVLLSHDDHWWGLLPAGVMTLMGILMGLQARLSDAATLAIFFLGLGLVFGLLYLLRLGQQDTGWAGVPTGALLLMGLVTLVGAAKWTGPLAQYWPITLLILGLLLLVLAIGTRRPSTFPVPASGMGAAAPESAPASGGGGLSPQPVAPAPAGPAPAAPTSAAPVPAAEKPADIYTLLSQQPLSQQPQDQGEQK